MFCEVIELRKNGLRLRPEEWPAPVAGQLRMAQWDSSHTSYHRTIRKLVLWVPWGTQIVPGPWLGDAQLVDVVGDAQLLRGDALAVVLDVQDLLQLLGYCAVLGAAGGDPAGGVSFAGVAEVRGVSTRGGSGAGRTRRAAGSGS